MAEGITAARPKAAALRALPLIDLADPADDAAAICQRARTPFGPVASVCVAPGSVPLAKELLSGTTARVTASADHPAAVAQAVAVGADEVEIVFPYDAFLAGEREAAQALVRQCRAACRRPGGSAALLKVVLETGRLGAAALVRAAATDAVLAGADIVATASGRVEPGGSLAAAQAMLEALAALRGRRLWAGLKASGTIRTLSEAVGYLALAERLLGAEFLSPATFRIGGGAELLGDLRLALGGAAER